MRPKARFTGSNPPPKASPNIDRLINRLRELWPPEGESSEIWGSPNDQFEQSLVDVLLWAGAARLEAKNPITKEDARAELNKLQKHLEEAERMLRSLSPDVDLLLGEHAAPLDCADAIAKQLGHVRAAEVRAKEFDYGSHKERERLIVEELCWRVAEVFKDYGRAVSATAVIDLDRQSPAVSVLQVIGELAGIPRSPATWRDSLAGVMSARK